MGYRRRFIRPPYRLQLAGNPNSGELGSPCTNPVFRTRIRYPIRSPVGAG